ncbi:hypothetical protein SDC9_161321 [bioreactor metagenome]|uniref:Uncharacterized protein n=1 Tax=bioreactor metagenome TaxID=1076179 RepID=A0A645FHT8_9ZZZZ
MVGVEVGEENIRPVHVDFKFRKPGGKRRPTLRKIEARVDYQAALAQDNVAVEVFERIVRERHVYAVHVVKYFFSHSFSFLSKYFQPALILYNIMV